MDGRSVMTHNTPAVRTLTVFITTYAVYRTRYRTNPTCPPPTAFLYGSRRLNATHTPAHPVCYLHPHHYRVRWVVLPLLARFATYPLKHHTALPYGTTATYGGYYPPHHTHTLLRAYHFLRTCGFTYTTTTFTSCPRLLHRYTSSTHTTGLQRLPLPFRGSLDALRVAWIGVPVDTPALRATTTLPHTYRWLHTAHTTLVPDCSRLWTRCTGLTGRLVDSR